MTDAHYAAGLEASLLEQNSALWKDALQQMREVRKLRRKLAKLHYLRRHPLNFAWWNQSTRSNGGVYYPSVLRSAAFTGVLALRRQQEGDGMHKFQAWQDLFRVWPSDATKLIAPSRKPDAEAIASAARKEGTTIEIELRDGVTVLKVKIDKC